MFSAPVAKRALAVTLAAIGLGAVAPHGALAVGPGDRAPDFELPLLDGEGRLGLAQFRGKVVWLDFWASWCPPCLASLPELEQMRKQMSADHFQIVAINIDADPRKARRFLEKHPVGYPSASDPDGRLPAKFDLEAMPTSYLIDRDGTVKLVHEGYRKGDIEKIRREVRELIEGGK